MKKFVVAAASAALLASTALSIAQDTSAEEEIIKKPGANSATEAAPSEPTSIAYDSPKPADVLEEDKAVGALDLGIRPENIHITPVEDVFA